MLKRLLLSFLSLTVYAAAAHGQEPVLKSKIADLAVFEGRWKVEVDSRLGPQGPWEKSTASAMIKKTLRATLIEEDFTGSRQGKPFEIKTVFGINNMTDRYQCTSADSEHGVLVDFEGVKNNDSIIFDRTWSYANGSSVKLRVIYRVISPDEFIVERMRMPQQANEWDVTGRMRYRRLK